VTGRERPNESDSAYDFKGPGGNGTNASFPSGHAGNAFAVASVMSEVYGDNNPWVPWLAYGVAGGVALSRINDNKHWASDAFLASALGFFIGKMVTRYNPFLEKNGVAMRPFAQDGAQGISLAVKF
jgi:membrane-associated phospholipid phosphatase